MNTASAGWSEARWRYFLLAIVAIGSIALMLSSPPIAQDPRYHEFADRRAFFGIPNFWDVVSNIPFLLSESRADVFAWGTNCEAESPPGSCSSPAWPS